MSATYEGLARTGVPEAVDVVPGAPIEDYGDEPEHSGAIRLGEAIEGTRLRVIERLSDGGSGVVFRGEHVDLGRSVAIKILRRVVRTDADRERFLAEARLATSIDSPHVVDVIDFGQLSDGRLWYAMELLDGRALSEEIEHSGRIPLARAFTLLRMACKGLAATHARGMVHCDVKPHNLVLVQRGGREQLVLVDFGIAHAIGTRPGSVCGTPEYISPEQLDRTELDPRTDVYALGCCAYEMFTGRLLVEETSVERAVSRHLLGIENELVFPPEAQLPECVQALIRSCLARDPDRRPASMAALEAAVCEAQIRCNVAPTREDLELPDVDRVRRDGIAIGFADMVGTRSSRRSHAFFGGMLSAAAAIAITVLTMRGDGTAEPTAALVGASLAALP
ncbi:MAG: serine/threonine protein kinase, partial [Deltaproteobacteria bacterium]|nr:serine/threonine protein kinase [Nannocystaceae bacterium]